MNAFTDLWRRNPPACAALLIALVVALSASNNFLSVSNPVLAMVSGPTGYRAKDLWRTGAPLTLVYLAIVLLVVNLMF